MGKTVAQTVRAEDIKRRAASMKEVGAVLADIRKDYGSLPVEIAPVGGGTPLKANADIYPGDVEHIARMLEEGPVTVVGLFEDGER